MSEEKQKKIKNEEISERRWRDLYRIGFISSLALPVSILVAIIAYFIYPYTPGISSVENIFTTLNVSPIEGLISLDLFMVILEVMLIPQMLALYMALRSINESYALIALAFGLMGILLIFTARPLAEMVYLSEQYAAATNESTKAHYLAAGEAVYSAFNGTTWMMSNIFIGISYTISSLIMIRSKYFSKSTAYTGIILSIIGFGFLIPTIGTILSLIGTIGGIIWYILLAKSFYKLGWD
ncbi:MAG: conserved membrane protein of unknown function [Promethearchaeota archaeon]|nr:MAG: conserved membrane protein of unknown function [Candidatus Lokiarchaeota archaeon]